MNKKPAMYTRRLTPNEERKPCSPTQAGGNGLVDCAGKPKEALAATGNQGPPPVLRLIAVHRPAPDRKEHEKA